ncbi:hypothetical protein C5C07_15265 [Haloferax sp. Atlit-4N]|uniref:hypothetical protein n=1 Tax=Haloferax sp. Atlit-4N TaxID=2077206 RepID=UPI000E24C136|nr:hypothetical protein [Haloferax sp. Atlit-4N]RDZ53092.1 hypothetical protein C5C07_15265 [Haloferax sp. Atlit-4N]
MTASDTGAIDYESPFPECRVLATTDPHALVRLDMNRDQAALFAKQCQRAIDRHDDGLVTLGLTMQEPTYRVFANQIANLVNLSSDVDGDEVISAQVVTDRELNPEDSEGISVSVLLNESQLHDVHGNAQDALAQSAGHLHRWEFGVSQNGAEMLVQQLVAAVKGADEPLDHVDIEGEDDA